MDILEHRGKHKYLEKNNAGNFLGKIKQEIELSGQTKDFPTMRKLMEELIKKQMQLLTWQLFMGQDHETE